jgi:hypothetical protein
MVVGLSLAEAEMVVWAASNHLGIVLILAVVMPEADLTDLVLSAPAKGFEFAAWASVCRHRFLALDDVPERLG